MWLKFFLLLTTLTVLCSGNKNTSCDFNTYYDWCGWELDKIQNCVWKVNTGKYNGNKGYLHLKGANQCSSSIHRKFTWNDDHTTNYLTIEYYVTGPGPFKLSVSNDNYYPPDWSCTIQPGVEKRTAHVAVTGSAFSIQIKGEVSKGSRIIITQIWNSLLGHKAQHACPSLLTTTPRLTTILTATTSTTKPFSISNVATVQSTFNKELLSTLARISKNNVQSTSRTITKFLTPGTRTNPESTSPNVRIGKSSAEIEKEKTKTGIIGGVAGVLTVIVLTVSAFIIIIIKRRKRTTYPVCELQDKTGNTAPYKAFQ